MDTNKATTTPKDFFLWAGAMIALYWSILAFIFLIFSYIDYAFPNVLQYYPVNPYDSGISLQMASIIVLLPLYLWLIRIIHKMAVKDPSRREIWVRRWALILTLFVAGVAIAGSLITVLTSYLSGEALTTAFLLKVALVLLVAAGVFMHFIADLKGYWVKFPMRRRYVGVAVGIVALASVLGGFLIVGTPEQARLARFDAQKVQDLQYVQMQIVSYWQAKKVLPVKLSDLNNTLAYDGVPAFDGQTGEAYTYKATGPLSFQLCAVFNAPSLSAGPIVADETRPIAPMKGPELSENWQHAAGEVCFDRVIDPARVQPQG